MLWKHCQLNVTIRFQITLFNRTVISNGKILVTRSVPYVWNASPKTDDCQFYGRILLQSVGRSFARTKFNEFFRFCFFSLSFTCALCAHKYFSYFVYQLAAAAAATAVGIEHVPYRFLTWRFSSFAAPKLFPIKLFFSADSRKRPANSQSSRTIYASRIHPVRHKMILFLFYMSSTSTERIVSAKQWKIVSIGHTVRNISDWICFDAAHSEIGRTRERKRWWIT